MREVDVPVSERGLEGGEQVVTMAIVRPLAGGKV